MKNMGDCHLTPARQTSLAAVGRLEGKMVKKEKRAAGAVGKIPSRKDESLTQGREGENR